MNTFLRFAAAIAATFPLASAAPAPPATVATPQASAAVREVAEHVLARFGKEAAGETVESLSKRLAAVSARHGDEGLEAVRRVGPRAFSILDEAGEHAGVAARLLARSGSEGAWLAARPRGLALAARFGDDGAEAMLRHKGIAEPLLSAYGRPAVGALRAVDGRGGRRLLLLHQDGQLARAGHADRLLGVVERYGDRALSFVWRNKAILGGGALLVAFLDDPEPYLEGAAKLTDGVGGLLAEPLAEGVRTVASHTDWTPVLLALVAVVGVYAAVRRIRRRA